MNCGVAQANPRSQSFKNPSHVNQRPVSNQTLHQDLKPPYVKNVIKKRSSKYQDRMEGHPNQILQPLTNPWQHRRLRRHWYADLIQEYGGRLTGEEPATSDSWLLRQQNNL